MLGRNSQEQSKSDEWERKSDKNKMIESKRRMEK